MRISGFLIISLFGIGAATGQGTWTLEACIREALRVSPEVMQARINSDLAEINKSQAAWNRWPDLSLSSGQFVQNGRTIDRFTNTFAQTQVFNNNLNLQTGVLLYNGGQARMAMHQARLAFLASEAEVEVATNNIALTVANFYLQGLQASELIRTAEGNLQGLEQQVTRMEKLLAAGSAAPAALASLKAQLAGERVNLIAAENQYEQSIAGLKVLLQLPFEEQMRLADPPPFSVERFNPSNYRPDSIFELALESRPEIKAADRRLQSVGYGLKSARGAYGPTISFGMNISTVYSDNAKRITGSQITGTRPIGFVQGSNQIVETFDINYNTATIPFSNQYRDNIGQGAGIQMNWQLFNRRSVHYNIAQAKLNIMAAESQLIAARNRLYSDVLNAWTGFRQAYLRNEANRYSLEAQELNLQNAEAAFQVGQMHQTDLQVARSAAFAARSNQIISKYEVIFRKMILDFYAGKPIILNP